jgi:hypothetical protein
MPSRRRKDGFRPIKDDEGVLLTRKLDAETFTCNASGFVKEFSIINFKSSKHEVVWNATHNMFLLV